MTPFALKRSPLSSLSLRSKMGQKTVHPRRGHNHARKAAKERRATARRGKGKAKEKAKVGEANPAAVGEAKVEVGVAARKGALTPLKSNPKARKGRVVGKGRAGKVRRIRSSALRRTMVQSGSARLTAARCIGNFGLAYSCRRHSWVQRLGEARQQLAGRGHRSDGLSTTRVHRAGRRRLGCRLLFSRILQTTTRSLVLMRSIVKHAGLFPRTTQTPTE